MSINLLKAVKAAKKSNRKALLLKTSHFKNNQGNHFKHIADLVNAGVNNEFILKGVAILSEKLNGVKWTAEHFGRVGMIPLGKLLSNIDIQRGVEFKHIGKNIMPIFDPRITQPINVIYYEDTDTYTAWDGQQTASTILALIAHGIIDTDNWETFEVKANIIDSTLTVPGTEVTVAEAVANFGFRTLNGNKAKKQVDLYHVMRSEYHGVKLYGSNLQEDRHSYAMWEVMLKYNMLPADKESTAKPGHISHISGMKKMCGHDTDHFNIKNFERTIAFLSKNFSNDNGINASFYMAIAHLFNLIDAQVIRLGTKDDEFNQDRFAAFILATYGKINTSDAFRSVAAKRLAKVREAQKSTSSSWTDDCALPFMLDDYRKYCKKHGFVVGSLPVDEKSAEYTK